MKLNDNLEKNCSQSQLEKNIQEGLNKSLKGQYMELNIVQLLKKIDYLNKFELLNIGSHIFNVLNKPFKLAIGKVEFIIEIIEINKKIKSAISKDFGLNFCSFEIKMFITELNNVKNMQIAVINRLLNIWLHYCW